MKHLLLLTLFLCWLTPGHAESPTLVCGNNNKNIWYPSELTEKKGVMMLSHGLNTNAVKMNDLVKFYTSQGYDVLLTILTGHDGNRKEFQAVTREKWIQDMYSAYCAAQAKANEEKLPLFFTGYSVSGLIAEDLIENYPDQKVQFEKMILFAPAISVKPFTGLVKALNVFGKGYMVPSFSNPEYRVCNGTPIAAYDSLFASYNMLNKTEFSHSRQTPTLVFIDPKDELVSASGIKKIISSKHLNNWSLVEVTNYAATTKVKYHHFIVAEEAVGSHVWKQTLEAISASLDGHSQPRSSINNADSCGKDGKPWKTPMSDSCTEDAADGCDRSQHECKPI